MKVSLCVIAYNEERCLPALLADVAAQDYPHADLEVILVDGCSADGTRRLMEEFRLAHPDFWGVTVLDNPKRVQPSSWNVAISHSRGEAILRVDAHALIPPAFVRKNVECLERGEDICGGRRINVIDGEGHGKRILLMAENSLFGSGVASYRRESKKQYVKTLAHACYRREVFAKVGLFNEELLRSEDNELHDRIRRAGYRICSSGEIVSEYQTRASLSGMVRQKFGNGLWVGKTAKIRPSIFSLYHYVPLLFVLALIAGLALLVTALCLPRLWWLSLPLAILAGAYLLCDLALTVKSVLGYREWLGLLALPVLFPLLHIVYGVGTLCGLFCHTPEDRYERLD